MEASLGRSKKSIAVVYVLVCGGYLSADNRVRDGFAGFDVVADVVCISEPTVS